MGRMAGALAPERFRGLATLAIPHPGRAQREGIRKFPSQLRNFWYRLFFQLRGRADFAREAQNWAFSEKLWRDWSPGGEAPAQEIAHLKRSLGAPGVKRAALGYYRAMVGRSTPGTKQTLELLQSKIRVPTLALRGALADWLGDVGRKALR